MEINHKKQRLSVWQASVILLVGLLLWGSWQAVHAQATPGRVAFVSDQDGTPKVYTMLLDGSDIQLLGNGIFEDGGYISFLSISPDGSRAAFISRKNRDGIYPTDELFLLGIASGSVTPLTDDGFDKSRPLWLSDISLIYLSGGVGSDHAQVLLMSLDQEQSRVVTDGVSIGYALGQDFGVSLRDMSLSPDKQSLILAVQTSLPDAYNVLVTLNIDGTVIHQVTANEISSFAPIWSSEADFVYYGCGFDGYHEICQLNPKTLDVPQIMTDFRSSLPDERKHYLDQIDVTPDNQILFQLSFSHNIYRLNLTDGSITSLMPGDTSDKRMLGWVYESVDVVPLTPTPKPG